MADTEVEDNNPSAIFVTEQHLARAKEHYFSAPTRLSDEITEAELIAVVAYALAAEEGKHVGH